MESIHSIQIYFWHFFADAHSASFKNWLNQIDWANCERRQKQKKNCKKPTYLRRNLVSNIIDLDFLDFEQFNFAGSRLLEEVL